MRDIMQRAQAYGTLTPGERAALRLIEGLAFAALVAALPIVADALSRQGVNWGDVGRAALAAGVTAALLALSKYLRAQGDPPLASVATVDVTARSPASTTSSTTKANGASGGQTG
ncbi:MAG TPA: hypothetical protein VMV29_03480 [Ktedonobacterales bacterium]|nr:hypothetical protein [Ktedonobacterales bacterium]